MTQFEHHLAIVRSEDRGSKRLTLGAVVTFDATTRSVLLDDARLFVRAAQAVHDIAARGEQLDLDPQLLAPAIPRAYITAVTNIWWCTEAAGAALMALADAPPWQPRPEPVATPAEGPVSPAMVLKRISEAAQRARLAAEGLSL